MISPINTEQEREDTFHTVADANVTEEKHATFKPEPDLPSTSEHILVLDEITGNAFHVEEAMTELVLKTITAQKNRADNRLSAVMESSVDRIFREVVSSPRTAAQVTEAVKENHRLIAPMIFFVKLEQR